MVRASGQCPSVPYFRHFLHDVKWSPGIKIKYFENNKLMIMQEEITANILVANTYFSDN